MAQVVPVVRVVPVLRVVRAARVVPVVRAEPWCCLPGVANGLLATPGRRSGCCRSGPPCGPDQVPI
ncbi:hypothetical protein [Cryobacterium mannosilyticum]|uniref:Uncharacterized protein n=1 Tax=Cryobacterium mannosilyticum TaxID=1259190 RepID=A0A4R8WAQ5_9MICO|nr:hypothetical protein [Cryobacterium mannosilyticum]TFC05826.1 hypothetical protein E3O32_05570 [Cryobacterium mannosilyticum]